MVILRFLWLVQYVDKNTYSRAKQKSQHEQDQLGNNQKLPWLQGPEKANIEL